MTGDYIVISSPAGDATAEIRQAITLVENTGKRVYIQTAGRIISASGPSKYSKIQEDGDLRGRVKLDEVVARMDP